MSEDLVSQMVAPLANQKVRLQKQVAAFDRLRQGDFSDFTDLDSLGKLLIAIRIATGMSQQQFAKRLGKHPSQVSRDERSEYRGVSIERVLRILNEFGFSVNISVSSSAATLKKI